MKTEPPDALRAFTDSLAERGLALFTDEGSLGGQSLAYKGFIGRVGSNDPVLRVFVKFVPAFGERGRDYWEAWSSDLSLSRAALAAAGVPSPALLLQEFVVVGDSEWVVHVYDHLPENVMDVGTRRSFLRGHLGVLARGLDALRAAGFVYTDLKLENFRFTATTPYLVDLETIVRVELLSAFERLPHNESQPPPSLRGEPGAWHACGLAMAASERPFAHHAFTAWWKEAMAAHRSVTALNLLDTIRSTRGFSRLAIDVCAHTWNLGTPPESPSVSLQYLRVQLQRGDYAVVERDVLRLAGNAGARPTELGSRLEDLKAAVDLVEGLSAANSGVTALGGTASWVESPGFDLQRLLEAVRADPDVFRKNPPHLIPELVRTSTESGRRLELLEGQEVRMRRLISNSAAASGERLEQLQKQLERTGQQLRREQDMRQMFTGAALLLAILVVPLVVWLSLLLVAK